MTRCPHSRVPSPGVPAPDVPTPGVPAPIMTPGVTRCPLGAPSTVPPPAVLTLDVTLSPPPVSPPGVPLDVTHPGVTGCPPPSVPGPDVTPPDPRCDRVSPFPASNPWCPPRCPRCPLGVPAAPGVTAVPCVTGVPSVSPLSPGRRPPPHGSRAPHLLLGRLRALRAVPGAGRGRGHQVSPGAGTPQNSWGGGWRIPSSWGGGARRVEKSQIS